MRRVGRGRTSQLFGFLTLCCRALAGRVSRTNSPRDPYPNLHGTCKGTRTELVFNSSGVVIPDITVISDLTLAIEGNSVILLDSQIG